MKKSKHDQLDMEVEGNDVEARLQALSSEVGRLKRDRARLRQSVSFRLGLHLTRAVRQPWRLLVLPITFPWVCLNLGLERLGRKPAPVQALLTGPEATGIEKKRRSVLLFPTNGVGFGHFSRMYAFARKLRKADPTVEVVFFTTMPTLHVAYAEGFPTYHLAGRYKHEGMTSSTWNGLVEDMLRTVMDVHQPAVFVFDGAFPYRGMLNAIGVDFGMHAVWVRRGMLRPTAKIPVDSIKKFDCIVHPGDATKPFDSTTTGHNVPILSVPPMLIFEQEELHTRDFARRRIGLPNEGKAVYVQLGAGRINDIESEVRSVVDALLEEASTWVVLGESMLGDRLNVDLERVLVLRDYPNALLLNAFDASVQAGGYNSFHEMRSVGLPTLFLPNMETGMDDQLARCKVAEEEGWGLVNTDRTKQGIRASISNLHALERQPPFPSDSDSTDSFVEHVLRHLP